VPVALILTLELTPAAVMLTMAMQVRGLPVVLQGLRGQIADMAVSRVAYRDVVQLLEEG